MSVQEHSADEVELQHVSAEAFAHDLARRLSEQDRIEPRSLAQLFRYGAGQEPHCLALRHTLQKYLFHKTLEHACAHTEYYRDNSEYKNWQANPGCDQPRLDELPILDRQFVVKEFASFIADDVTLRSICHTSGTTGQPLDVYKSFEEVAFLNDYFIAFLEPIRPMLKTLPLSLSFPNFYHGVPVPLPGLGLGLVSGVTDDTLIVDAARVLAQTYDLKGYDSQVTLLSGLGHHVLFFTNYLHEQGLDPSSFKLNAVTITGGFIASHWMTFLQQSWACIVNNRFTLTEVIGGASREHDSDVFHLDHHLIGETLDPDTFSPMDSGIGLLALTNLFPFVQMQPLVRYLTGDLVRRHRRAGTFAFQFLGKTKNCVSIMRDNRREWLLFSSRLNDILCAISDVRFYDWFSNVTVAHDRSVGSLPLVSVETEQRPAQLMIRISIELRYAPHVRTAHVETLRRRIVTELQETPDTALKQRMEDGTVVLEVRFFGPGGLKGPIVIKI